MLAAALLSSAKDNEEHGYAAASMHEAIAPLCATLEIAPHPELIRFANLQHLGTWMRGTLAADRSALALAAAVHPTAAVGGTPTDAAVELIRELENMDRERYAGPVGWVDADGNGEWGIALRCAQLAGDRARLFAGCGIVAGSDPAAELAEAQVKFRPMQTALEQPDLWLTTETSTGRTGTSGCPRTWGRPTTRLGGSPPILHSSAMSSALMSRCSATSPGCAGCTCSATSGPTRCRWPGWARP